MRGRGTAAAGGFSLVEVVIAVGVFTVAGIGCIALFGSILKTSASVSSREGAVRLDGALVDVLQSKTFSQIYGWLQNDAVLYAYTYLALAQDGSDGQPIPAVRADAAASFVQVRLVPSLRNVEDARLYTELGTVQGPVYRVMLGLSKANTVQSLPAANASYTEAVLMLTASFYPVARPTNGVTPPYFDPPIDRCAVSYKVR